MSDNKLVSEFSRFVGIMPTPEDFQYRTETYNALFELVGDYRYPSSRTRGRPHGKGSYWAVDTRNLDSEIEKAISEGLEPDEYKKAQKVWELFYNARQDHISKYDEASP